MNDRRSHTRPWLAKAESDLLAAQRLLAAGGPFDAVCFHAQQACAKALKAVLAWAERDLQRTHNLEDLQAACVLVLPDAGALRSLDLSQLTPYAVETRYDAEFWPDGKTAADACGVAEQVMSIVPPLVAST
jgi:HEPN domain-containing protein